MSLTELETRILKATVNSGGTRLSIDQVAAEVGCSPDTIYQRLMNKPDFQELFKASLVNSITPAMPKVMNAFVKEAEGGSFKHSKLLMEITGIYKEEKQSNINLNVHDSEEPFKDDGERKEFLKSTLSELVLDE